MAVYEWFWEDDPELMLPHAKHINIATDDGEEIAVVVLPNEFMNNEESRARVQGNASLICKALNHYQEVR